MKPQVISFHYTLTDKAGKTLESSHNAEPIVCLEGSGQIIPGLEKELQGLKAGDKKKVSLKADEAYGEHNKDLIMDVPLDQLPETDDPVKVGFQFVGHSNDGNQRVFTVTKLAEKSATLDGNHPLAGQ